MVDDASSSVSVLVPSMVDDVSRVLEESMLEEVFSGVSSVLVEVSDDEMVSLSELSSSNSVVDDEVAGSSPPGETVLEESSRVDESSTAVLLLSSESELLPPEV